MDPNEILKHAPEILKGGAALAGALKFTDIIKAMLGPATAEIAERFRDEVRRYRYGRQLECLEKAAKMAKDAGFTPKAVPIKLLFPLLEGASLEENEDLHTMWAALLANAASPEHGENVRPGFIAILRQMAPDEAAILNWIYNHFTDPVNSFEVEVSEFRLGDAYAEFGLKDQNSGMDERDRMNRLWICLDGLEGSLLLRRHERASVNSDSEVVGEEVGRYVLTDRGRAFVIACRQPGLKK